MFELNTWLWGLCLALTSVDKALEEIPYLNELSSLKLSTLLFWPTWVLIGFIFLFFFKRWLGIQGTFYTIVYMNCFVILTSILMLLLTLVTGEIIGYDFGKITIIKVWVDFRLLFVFDILATALTIVVSGLTILAMVFGVEYMCREAFVNRMAILLSTFSVCVILLFCVYDFFLIVVLWEAIGIFSFMLVNYYSQRIYTMKAAYKTFVFSRISDLAMFTAYILIGLMFHTTDLSALFFKVPFYIFHLLVIGPFGFNFLFVLSTLILIAGGIKAAQFYSHVWLPDAMEAPTPASALIHSSTLVIMGIFLIIRFSILFEFSPITNYIMVIWGGYTIAYGAVVASNQDDIKKLVAYSTISQMGYLVCGCGYGAYEEVLIYMIIHAINKAFLFIIVGYTVHFFNGNTDLRQISHIYLYASDICIFIFFTCLNLLGLPYLMGFYAKEFLVLDTITGGWVPYYVRACWLVSFYFTPVYMILLAGSIVYYPVIGDIPYYWKLYKEYLVNLRFMPDDWSIFYRDMPILNLSFRMYIQYCLYTSRATVVVMLVSFLLFNYMGEYLFMCINVQSTAVEALMSPLYTSPKQITITSVINFGEMFQNHLFYIIIIFLMYALKNLVNRFYRETDKYYTSQFVVELMTFFSLFLYIAIYFS